jgi:hypothetical protein
VISVINVKVAGLHAVREAEELSAMLHGVSTGMSVLVEVLILV